MAIEFPVFVRVKETDEVYLCDSVYKMQFYFEEIDIENSEYEAWDNKGLPLKMTVQAPIWLNLEIFSPEARSVDLKMAIVRHGLSLGVRVSDEEVATLDCQTLYVRIAATLQSRKSSSSIFKKFFGGRSG